MTSLPPSAPRSLFDSLLASPALALIAVVAIVLVLADAGVAIGRSSSHHSSTSAATQSPPVTPVTTPSGVPMSPPVPTSPATTSAESALAEQLATTFRRAISQHTVHSVARDVSAKDGTTIFDDYDGVRVGEQHITINGGRLDIRVVGPTTYLTGDGKGLREYGFNAQEVRALDGQWLSLVAGQSGYQSVTAGVTLASTLDEDRMVGPLRRRADKTLDGEQVFGISGQGAHGGAAPGEQATLWISLHTGLPVEYEASSSKSKLTTIFTDWGKPINVETPARVYGQPGLAS